MYRIMIVEDDEVIARAVQQSLVSWGMDAFCVQDFSSVLAEFAVKNPQLVLMDIHLPFFNGFHWCQGDSKSLESAGNFSFFCIGQHEHHYGR